MNDVIKSTLKKLVSEIDEAKKSNKKLDKIYIEQNFSWSNEEVRLKISNDQLMEENQTKINNLIKGL
jgi:hypothetical protein